MEDVEITLIANGQSVQVNPLLTNIIELDKWVGNQLKSNNDFELLVKSRGHKLLVDVEPITNESSKTTKPIQIVSDDNEIIQVENSDPIKTVTQTENKVSKNLQNTLSQSEKPKEGVKPILEAANIYDKNK